jgi:hypothetical protein
VIAFIRGRPATAVLALLGVMAGVLIMSKARGTTFYYDEWNFVLERRDWNFDTFLQPHNEHFSLLPILFYKLMFAIVGLDHYGAYRLAILLVHLVIVVLLFALASRRIGDWAALALCLPLLFLGGGWLDILWAFQLGFLIAIAAALGVMLALERGDRRGDGIACALLVVAICSSSLGVPIAIAVGASILLRPDRRERAWIFIVPLAIYAVWYLGYGKSAVKASNINDTTGYVAEAAAGAMSAVSGLGIEFGRVLAVLLAIFVVRELLDPRRFSPRLVMLVVLPFAFWALTALARAQLHEPTSPRYLYPGAVFLLLLLAYFLERDRLRPPALVLLLIAALASAVSNTQGFTTGGNQLKAAAAEIKAELAAVEVAGPYVSPAFLASQLVSPIQPQIKAGPYLDAIRDIGSSPAFTEAELRRMGPPLRQAADRELVTLYEHGLLNREKVTLGHSGERPRVGSVQGARLTARRSCDHFEPGGGSPLVDLVVPEGGVRITPEQRDPVELRLRRFSDTFAGDPLNKIPSVQTIVLRIRKDSSPRPWHVELKSQGSFKACGLRPSVG